MKEEINMYLIQSLIEIIGSFPETRWLGGSTDIIINKGKYEEGKFVFLEEDLPLGLLYAGLAILARDMYLYILKNPRKDAELFKKVVECVNIEETALYVDRAFPYYHKDLFGVNELPDVLDVTSGTPSFEVPFGPGCPTINIEPLKNPSIIHEWTVKPGKKLFVTFLKRFGRNFKETICGKDGVYEEIKTNKLQKDALPTVIVTAIITAGFSPQTFWYPIAVYITLILLKVGLKTYCESPPLDPLSIKPIGLVECT